MPASTCFNGVILLARARGATYSSLIIRNRRDETLCVKVDDMASTEHVIFKCGERMAGDAGYTAYAAFFLR
jgi:hypothetical protein